MKTASVVINGYKVTCSGGDGLLTSGVQAQAVTSYCAEANYAYREHSHQGLEGWLLGLSITLAVAVFGLATYCSTLAERIAWLERDGENKERNIDALWNKTFDKGDGVLKSE